MAENIFLGDQPTGWLGLLDAGHRRRRTLALLNRLGAHLDPDRIVSASRDHTLRVWSLKEKGAIQEYDPLAGRGGSVDSLGVSDDGRFMLFDRSNPQGGDIYEIRDPE